MTSRDLDHALSAALHQAPVATAEVASALTSPKTHLTGQSLSRMSPTARERAASNGEAMPDGSFPIRDAQDLRRSIQSFGRAKDKGAAKRHIIRRARTLGKIDLLPDAWQALATKQFPGEQREEVAQVVVASAPTPLDDELTLKAERHNLTAPDDRLVSLPKLKAVYRRGLEAYSERPCVTPDQHAHARVNSFLRLLASGAPDSWSYTQDNDLLPVSHPARERPFD